MFTTPYIPCSFTLPSNIARDFCIRVLITVVIGPVISQALIYTTRPISEKIQFG